MQNLFSGNYKGKRVLVTGHSGFKGSWLVLWLSLMGARVLGYSLKAPTNPNHISLLNLDIEEVIGDIRDFELLDKTFANFKPDIVFHLAAQPLVRLSYEAPIETYETNVIGTLKVLEACKKHSVKSIVNITSDKAYENKEWCWGYREDDPLGGHDPYSSSKGCADILVNSYRNSYFNLKDYKIKHNTLLASCRAGNVIGGGDWAKDRLVVDIMLAASKGEKVLIRNPLATRPWQHVLEPLSGYLHLGSKLLEERAEFSGAWNFGPSDEGNINVKSVVESIKSHWDKVDYEISSNKNDLHEANLLKLDCSKAHFLLKWKGVWNSQITFEKTANWYKEFYENSKVLTQDDLNSYIKDANKIKMEWAI